MAKNSELRWRRTDESVHLAHCLDHAEQFLFYARTYTIGRGFNYSKTNQLIINLKKSPQASQPELRYKQQAIQQFAREVIDLLRTQLSPERSLTLVPMPPSKSQSHPNYDDRLEQVAKQVATKFENVSWLLLLYMTKSTESYHSRSDRRDPRELYTLMRTDSNQIQQCQRDSIIALLDDVLTSGAHYTAAQRRILAELPDADVIGIFWAKAVSPDDFLDD
jgi:predicted amidophosphoribosyltransferase